MRHLFKLFTLFIIAVQLVSCEAEKIATHSGTRLLVSKKISLQQFLQETKINNFDASIHLENKVQNKTADGSYELTDFNIDIDVINRMEYDQKTTYSFVTSPKDIITENYFNLIYYKKNNVWEMKIVELKPNPDNLIQLQSGLTTEFEGQMRMVYETVPTIMSQPCTYVTITVENCQGCVGTCDQCSRCVSSTTYSFCNQVIQFISAPPLAPSGFSSGSGGGGGFNSDPNEIVFDPNLANLDIANVVNFNLFLNNLRTTDLVGFNYLNSHPKIKNQVLYHLVLNSFNSDSKIYSNFAIGKIKNGAKVNFQKKIINDPSFIGSKSECTNNKLSADPTSFYSQMLSNFNNSTNFNLTFKVGATQNGDWGITNGAQNNANNYEITVSQSIENGSNLMRMLTLSHELIHAYIFSTLETAGLLNFDVNGDGLLNISCIQNTNYNAVNLNTLSTKDRFEAIFCAMNQNGTLTSEWTHNLFNTTNFNVSTYRQALENMIFNEYDWDNEEIAFKNLAISTFGTNWRRELAKGVSYIGLENTTEYQNYINEYSLLPIKILYLTDIRNKISTAKNTCL